MCTSFPTVFRVFDEIDIEDIQPKDYKSQKISLSSFVEEMSGKRMDKREIMSNWNNTILRKEQKMSAAIDAFALIELYDWINDNTDNQITILD